MIIGFMAPGMIGLYAASLHAPVLQNWFDAAANARTTVGGFLFIVIASSGMGVFLSGVRWFFVERLIKRGVQTKHDPFRRREPETELVYQNIRHHHYDFYFVLREHAGRAVALVALQPGPVPLRTHLDDGSRADRGYRVSRACIILEGPDSTVEGA